MLTENRAMSFCYSSNFSSFLPSFFLLFFVQRVASTKNFSRTISCVSTWHCIIVATPAVAAAIVAFAYNLLLLVQHWLCAARVSCKIFAQQGKKSGETGNTTMHCNGTRH